MEEQEDETQGEAEGLRGNSPANYCSFPKFMVFLSHLNELVDSLQLKFREKIGEDDNLQIDQQVTIVDKLLENNS